MCIIVVVVIWGGSRKWKYLNRLMGLQWDIKEESVEREITMHVDICQHPSANKYPAIEVGYG